METVFSLDSTIFAWATAGERATRGILRLSGPSAIGITKKVFVPDEPCDFSRGVAAGTLVFPQDVAIRCQIWILPGPHSYTGQDMVEIHTVSSPPLQHIVNEKLLGLGLTPARPGEFTARAFLLGKMDLTQAQAVGQLVEAQNDAEVQAAMNMLGGDLHRRIESVYRVVSELTIALEANIDFSEEDIEIVSREDLAAKLESIRETIAGILDEAIDIQTIRSIPRVYLVGPANAGKSTLLNRLTGLDRAICSALPGTTRDILTAIWRYRGREVMLCDTPGLLDSAPDMVTLAAIERVKPYVQLADLVVLVLDAQRDIQTQLQLAGNLPVHKGKAMTVLNKVDLVTGHGKAEGTDHRDGQDFVPISALTGRNLEKLASVVFERLSNVSLTTAANQVALDLRGREILKNTLACIDLARSDSRALGQEGIILGLETVAVNVQQALRTLGSLLGKDITEDVLDNIFSRFCIGK